MRTLSSSRFRRRLLTAAACLLAALGAGPGRADAATEPARDAFRDVRPILSEYCVRCHSNEKPKADLSIEKLISGPDGMKAHATWAKILDQVQKHEMPPDNKPQPSDAQRTQLLGWIEQTFFAVDCDKPDPGRVTIRRLNRAEYNNTIRDLVGVDFKPAEDFPADDVGYGFDNIGDVLSLPPLLLERYLAAAEAILDRAILVDRFPGATTNRFAAVGSEATAPTETAGEWLRLSREGDVHVTFQAPFATECEFTVRAYGEQAGPEKVKMAFQLDGKEFARFEVAAVKDATMIYTGRTFVAAGTHKFGAVYLNNFVGPKPKDPKEKRPDRNLLVRWLQVNTPAATDPLPLPESHRRLIFTEPARPNDPSSVRQALAQVLDEFMRRAYRRPLHTGELDRVTGIAEAAYREERSFERAVQVGGTAVLVSPHFLFRHEARPEPANAARIVPVDQFALASRLSYFLWSSLPDDELTRLASGGRLRSPGVLEAQVQRMLQDPRSDALVANFASQWLQTRNLARVAPEPKVFPQWNDALRADLLRETELFFTAVMRDDRSVLDLLDGRYTFVNERLARLYGIPGITGDEFRRVNFTTPERGGLLTQGAILTITSNPTRTSPVKRGKWVLENLLASPPPPPPPDVPELPEKKGALKGTLRQRLEQHRADPTCASCHDKMDPIGFGLENFNGIGAWRDLDDGAKIDTSGVLPGGRSFAGPAELRALLLAQKDQFIRCLSDRLLTYALGRGLEPYDRCALDRITAHAAKHNYRFSQLILAIVESVPFQQTRGDALQAGK